MAGTIRQKNPKPKRRLFMHHKNIKLIIRKQLKKQCPGWNRLSKRGKKELARLVLTEVVDEYDFCQEIASTKEELLGIEEQIPAKGTAIPERHPLREFLTLKGEC